MTRAEQQARRRAAQRAAARRHHPDLGGRGDDLVAAFAAIDRAVPDRTAPDATGRVSPPGARPAARVTGTARTHRVWWRRVKTALRRRRRYIEI